MHVRRHQWLVNVVIVGAPLLLAFVEWFHPHPHVLLQLDVRTWLAVHYLQIPLFPLTALAIALLVHGLADIAAAVCRVAMFVFAVSFIAFDTAAGVVQASSCRPRRIPAIPMPGVRQSMPSGIIRSWAARRRTRRCSR